MHLKDVEDHVPGEAAGRYGRVVTAGREAGREVPQIYHLFAYKPEAAKHLGNFCEEVLRRPSALTPGQRELVAAWTSARNDCLF